jgi:hypothetical protein
MALIGVLGSGLVLPMLLVLLGWLGLLLYLDNLSR